MRFTLAYPETATAGLRFLALALLALTVSATLRRRRHLRFLAGAVVWLGVCCGLLALVQWQLGTEPLLGLYQPETSRASAFSGPFVNPNHLGVLCAFASLVALGLWRSSETKWPWCVAWLVCLAWTSLSTSVVAFAALGVGHIVAFAYTRPGWRLTLAACAAGIVSFVLLLAVAGDVHPTQAYQPKLETIRAALRTATTYPLLGGGGGSFGYVSTPFFEALTAERNSFPEADWATLLSDFGLVGGVATILLVLCVGWITLRQLKQRTPLQVGIASGFVAVCAASLFSFNLIALGVMFPVVALVAGANALDAPRRVGRVSSRLPALLVLALVVPMALFLFAATEGPTPCPLGDAVSGPDSACTEARLSNRPTEARALLSAAALAVGDRQTEILSSAEQHAGNDPEALAVLGWLRGHRGEVSASVSAFQRSTALSDTGARASVVLGLDALSSLQDRVQALAPNDVSLQYTVSVLRERGEYDWAFLFAEAAWLAYPSRVSLGAVVDQAAHSLSSHEAAIGFARRGQVVLGDEANSILARALRQGGELDESLAEIRRAPWTRPSDFRLAQELLLLWLDHRDVLDIPADEVDRALRTVASYQAVNDDRAGTSQWLQARVAIERGQWAHACALYRQMLSGRAITQSDVPRECAQ